METLKGLNTNGYEGSVITYEADKIPFILSTILNEPASALIIEPAKNEYWMFYTGGITFPANEDETIKFIDFAKIAKSKKAATVERMNGPEWNAVKIKVDEEFMFTIYDELDKINKLDTIKVAILQENDSTRYVFLNYKT